MLDAELGAASAVRVAGLQPGPMRTTLRGRAYMADQDRDARDPANWAGACVRSEEHTSELQSLMRISYAVFCLKKKKNKHTNKPTNSTLNIKRVRFKRKPNQIRL